MQNVSQSKAMMMMTVMPRTTTRLPLPAAAASGGKRVRYTYLRQARYESVEAAAAARDSFAEAFPYDERSPHLIDCSMPLSLDQYQRKYGRLPPRTDSYWGISYDVDPYQRHVDDLAASRNPKANKSSFINYLKYSTEWDVYELVELRKEFPATGTTARRDAALDDVAGDSATLAVLQEAFEQSGFQAPELEIGFLNSKIAGYTTAVAPILDIFAPIQLMAMDNEWASLVESSLSLSSDALYTWNSAHQGGLEAGQWRPSPKLMQVKQNVDDMIAATMVPQTYMKSHEAEKQLLACLYTAIEVFRSKIQIPGRPTLLTIPAAVAAASAAAASLDGPAPIIVIGKDVTHSDALGRTTWCNSSGVMGSAALVFDTRRKKAGLGELSFIDVSVRVPRLHSL